MSAAGDIAWNTFISKHGKEAGSSQQLQSFSRQEPTLQTLKFKESRDTFNKNKGKGKLEGIQSTVKTPKRKKKSWFASLSNADHLAEFMTGGDGDGEFDGDGQNATSTEMGRMSPRDRIRSSSVDGSGDGMDTFFAAETIDDANFTGDYMKDPKQRCWAWFALILNAIAFIVSIINNSSVGSSVNSKMSETEAIMTGTDLSYEGMEGRDESFEWFVGNYWGWEFAQWRDGAYKVNQGGYHSGNDIQYPLPDLHVRLGDVLIFQQFDPWYKDDLYLVPEEVYETCNFSYPYDLTNDEGEMDNTSSLWLAYANDMHCPYESGREGSACQYEFEIMDWDHENNTDLLDPDDLFTQLITADTLYFVSSYNWNGKRGQSCKGGLKLKVHIDKTYRKVMPLNRSSDIWRMLAEQELVELFHASIGHISRNLVLQQFNHEQRVRSEGDSGISNVRGMYDGEAAYDDGTYTNGEAGALHDHPDHLRTIGMGEVEAVINGVEFKTRHNDYNLFMPSESSTEWHATQEIELPDVPSEVTNAGNVDAQISEMQEWFRAFKNQDISHRDYRPYFKPIFCYIEGTWILPDDDRIDEPFASDRHGFETRWWQQLHDKERWMANSGRKSNTENIAHLPTALRNLLNDTYPIWANWEYRILCHPLTNDIPTSRFRVSNDLSVQLMGSPQTREELYYSRRARFELNRYANLEDIDNDHIFSPGRKKWNYLDYIFEQVPGTDNYGCNLDDVYPDGSERAIRTDDDSPLNACYYTRFYALEGPDAMGGTGHRRGWCDRNLFGARTLQQTVSPLEFNFEQADEDGYLEYIRTVSSWTYAIPLEIIYLTPLTKWNPYNIPEKDSKSFDYGRSGNCDSTSTAFNGWTQDNSYFTPAGFFEDITISGSGDSHSDNVCAVGGDGKAYSVYPSGHWLTFPEIGGGVGKVRQRYPIFSIHAAGHGAFKEAKALQDVVLPDDYDDATNGLDFFGDGRDSIYGLEVNLQGGGHQHSVYIPGYKVASSWYDEAGNELSTSNDVVEVESDVREGHEHTIEIWRERVDGEWVYHLKRCRSGGLIDDDDDWLDGKCNDHHNKIERDGQ